MGKSEYTFPSKDDILRYFLHFHRKNNETLQDIARVIVQKMITIWSKKGIRCVEEHNLINKIKKVHENWLNSKKSSYLNSKHHVKKRENFIDELSCRFDITQVSSSNTIENEKETESSLLEKKDKRLLEDVAPIETRYTQNKSTTLSKNTTTKNTEGDKDHQKVKKYHNIVVVDENESELSDSSDTSYIPPTKIRKAIIPENDILTEEVCAALDRTKISYRNAFYIVAPMCQSMSQSSVLTIRRRRMEVFKKVAREIKQSFNPKVTLTIH